MKLKNIKILWASTREAYNYLQAKKTSTMDAHKRKIKKRSNGILQVFS